MRLLSLSAAFASLCILSCGSPTTVIPTRDTTKHDSIPNAFPPTQAITKRVNPNVFESTYWGNGWTSSALTYVRSPPCVPFSPSKRQSLTPLPPSQSALLPVNAAALHLCIFYSRIAHLSATFPPFLSAGTPAVHNGLRGQAVSFHVGGLELTFFSPNSLIPWTFVGTVAARLSHSAARGYTGLHGTMFQNEVMGLVVYVTMTAAGVPPPWNGLLPSV